MQDVDVAHWMAKRSHMLELMHASGWETLTAELETEEARAIANMLAGDKDSHDYWKGYITALRWCYHRPQKVIDLAERSAKDVTHG